MADFTSKCPYCKNEITLPVERWSTKEKCPECNNVVRIEYDFILMDDGEEWDLYEFGKNSKHEGKHF